MSTSTYKLLVLDIYITSSTNSEYIFIRLPLTSGNYSFLPQNTADLALGLLASSSEHSF